MKYVKFVFSALAIGFCLAFLAILCSPHSNYNLCVLARDSKGAKLAAKQYADTARRNYSNGYSINQNSEFIQPGDENQLREAREWYVKADYSREQIETMLDTPK